MQPSKGNHEIPFNFSSNKHDLNQLLVKDLTFYCILCLDHRWEDCENVHWTACWTPGHFADTTAIAMHDPGLGQNSADADGQAATVDVGDNVAFNAEAGNFKGV